MSERDKANKLGIQYYSVLCIGALVVLLLVCQARGAGTWSLLPVVLGLIGVWRRWSVAPVVVLAAAAAAVRAATQLSFPFEDRGASADPILDVVTAAALLAFVVGHYRLQSLTNYVFPPDAQRLREGRTARRFFFKRKKDVVKQVRSGAGVTKEEIGTIVFLVPLWVLGGVLCRVVISTADTWPTPLLPQTWRAMMIVWLFGLPVLIAGGLFRYWSWSRMSAVEATVFLQDQVWHETRREQRRLNRWLAWAKLRRQRRQEKA